MFCFVFYTNSRKYKISHPKELPEFAPNQLISINFGAGSPEMLPEWCETARNLDFWDFSLVQLCQKYEVRRQKAAKKHTHRAAMCARWLKAAK